MKRRGKEIEEPEDLEGEDIDTISAEDFKEEYDRRLLSGLRYIRDIASLPQIGGYYMIKQAAQRLINLVEES